MAGDEHTPASETDVKSKQSWFSSIVLSPVAWIFGIVLTAVITGLVEPPVKEWGGQFWQYAKGYDCARQGASLVGTTDKVALKDYLNLCPKGAFVDTVVGQLKELEDASFARAATSRSITEIEGYLANWPEGTHRAEARALISEIKDDETWETVRSKGTNEAVQTYLRDHPNGRHREEANQILGAFAADDQAWAAAQRTDTPEAYRTYLRAHKASAHYAEAQAAFSRLDEAAWGNAMTAKTSSACSGYLTTFPEGAHGDDAKDCVSRLSDDDSFQHAIAADTPAAMRTYIAEGRSHLGEAKQRLADLDDRAFASATTAESGLTAYLKEWADGRHRDEAERLLAALHEEADWQKTLETRTIDGFKEFVRQHETSAHAAEARNYMEALVDNADWDAAWSTNAAAAYHNYLEHHADGRHADEARAKLGGLDEVAWLAAKTVGTRASCSIYLESWSSGLHRTEAEECVKHAEEELLWVKTERCGSELACKDYLKAYPKGVHAGDARSRLADFEAQGWSSISKSLTLQACQSFLDQWDGYGAHSDDARECIKQFHAGEDCDRLAANADDPNRQAAPVAYADLNVAEAIPACADAIKVQPGTDRYRYQLARALQKAKLGEQAATLFSALVSRHYVAAYDNLGWLYMLANGVPHDEPRAVQLFRQGAAAGSTDAMVSLGDYFAFRRNDYAQARHWFGLAIEKGSAYAGQELQKMEDRLANGREAPTTLDRGSTDSQLSAESSGQGSPNVDARNVQLFMDLANKIIQLGTHP